MKTGFCTSSISLIFDGAVEWFYVDFKIFIYGSITFFITSLEISKNTLANDQHPPLRIRRGWREAKNQKFRKFPTFGSLRGLRLTVQDCREFPGFCKNHENADLNYEPAKQKIENVNRKLFLSMPNNHKNHINPAVAHLGND